MMKFSDIDYAFMWVSSGGPFENEAVVKLSTGEIFYRSDLLGEDDFPPDIDEAPDDYLMIPHKHDLDLGQKLVWEFVDREIPGLYGKVRSIFSRRGAYSRYKRFLDELDLLENWFEFEKTRTEEKLRAWCRDNDLEIEPDDQ